MDNRVVPLEEQLEEAKHSGKVTDSEGGPGKKAFKVTFTTGQSVFETVAQEGSMKVALARSFVTFKKSLPKRTRLKSVNVFIEDLGR